MNDFEKSTNRLGKRKRGQDVNSIQPPLPSNDCKPQSPVQSIKPGNGSKLIQNLNSIQSPLPSRDFKPQSSVHSIVPEKFKYARLRSVLTRLKLELLYAEFEKVFALVIAMHDY